MILTSTDSDFAVLNVGLAEKYNRVRKTTTDICEPLKTEDYVVQPMVDVSPPKWHLAHTTWFFENFILLPFKLQYQVFDKDYNYLFNSYYENVGSRVLRPERGNMTRPAVDDIMKYREYVDKEIDELIELTKGEDHKIVELIELGLQHEQQHQELLVTDIKYILGNNPLFPVYKTPILKSTKNISEFRKENYLKVEEGIYEIGYKGDQFCFDNERGIHKVFLHAFRFSDRLVTNGEYLEFINSGGYQDFNHWLADGWDWVKQNNKKSPLYWFQQDNDWYNYTLEGYQLIEPFSPVTHISFYEADAFAKWKGKRLLTEFEWEAACNLYSTNIYPKANFLETQNFHPLPSANGNNQMFGDAWEWTNSAYLPYPYYKKVDGALGEYNGKFMINQMILRGGSCATPSNHIRSTYRNFFPPDKQWQFTGIRLAEHL